MTICPNHNRRGAGLQVNGAQEKFVASGFAGLAS